MSLAVLGLIAGLTVPSIVAAVSLAKNRTLQKETIKEIAGIIQAGVLNGDFVSLDNTVITNSTAPIIQYFTGKFNGQNCPKGTTVFPCDFSFENVTSYENHSARWVLPNGVKIRSCLHSAGFVV